MRQSALVTKTRKADPADEESTNAKLLLRAGFVSKEMAGVYTILPLGYRVLNKIAAIIREEMAAIGGQEVFMPTLQPKANWKETGRWESYDALFRFESPNTQTEYVLGPTHEEIIVPLLKQYVSSYRDLPRYIFQIQNKFREEKRSKSGLLRGREFLMKDLYSFHATEEDLDQYYEIVQEVYHRIFERIGIAKRTYLTFASGGTFSKYSHEYQTLTTAGEDTIYICQNCSIAINEEIIDEQQVCPSCQNSEFTQEKAVEVGNIFKLKTKFSEPFGLTYRDIEGNDKLVLMGCYGIGLQRLIGTVVEALHDEQGIVWPESIAPFRAHLLALPGGEKEAESLYEKLQASGLEVLYDDRTETSPGEKFSDADLLGIPYRVVVSEKTVREGAGEVKKRTQEQSSLVPLEQIPASLAA